MKKKPKGFGVQTNPMVLKTEGKLETGLVCWKICILSTKFYQVKGD